MTNIRIRNHLFLLITVAIMIVILGCEKTPQCTIPEDLLNLKLDESSKEYFENYKGASKIIFANHLNQELEFVVSEITDSNLVQFSLVSCEDGTQGVTSNTQLMGLELTNPKYPSPFRLSLSSSLTKELVKYDSFHITYFNASIFHYNFNGDNPYITLVDSIYHMDKFLYDVIEMTTGIFTISIEKNVGILGIRDHEDQKDYWYKGKE